MVVTIDERRLKRVDEVIFSAELPIDYRERIPDGTMEFRSGDYRFCINLEDGVSKEDRVKRMAASAAREVARTLDGLEGKTILGIYLLEQGLFSRPDTNEYELRFKARALYD